MNVELLRQEWFELLKDELTKDYFIKLKEQLKFEYNNYKIHPKPMDIFNAFVKTPFSKVRVLLLLQDPYHNTGSDNIDHAHGLALSSLSKDTPYSLQRVLRELDRDLSKSTNYQEFKQAFPNNNLTPWANQGVMLLNCVLTVRANQPASHLHVGWQQFTSKVLELLYQDDKPKVFITLGSDATKAVSKFDKTKHLFLESGHPASAAHGKDKFSGCNVFSKTNHYFYKKGLETINWRLNNE